MAIRKRGESFEVEALEASILVELALPHAEVTIVSFLLASKEHAKISPHTNHCLVQKEANTNMHTARADRRQCETSSNASPYLGALESQFQHTLLGNVGQLDDILRR